MKGILDGIRVLDMTRYIAGPYCGMILADMGADVIKLEKAGFGDDTRHLEPWFKDSTTSLYFASYNRNKKSVSIDFRSAEGVQIIKDLVKVSDVFIENFRPGVMAKMGLSYEEIKEINPGIIMLSISGYGQTGPYRDRACFDGVAQSVAGLAAVTGDPEGKPVTAGASVADQMSSMYAIIGVISALYEKQRTGVGQFIDVDMITSVSSLMQMHFANYSVNGILPVRRGARERDSAPGDIYRASDGYVKVHAGVDSMFKRLKTIIDDPVLKQEKYEDNETRRKEWKTLSAIMDKWMAEHTCAEVDKIFAEAGIPVGIVSTVDKLLENEHLRERGNFVQIPVVGNETATFAAFPIRFSNNPVQEYRRAPLLGEHTREVCLGLLGMEEEDYRKLVEKGVLYETDSAQV